MSLRTILYCLTISSLIGGPACSVEAPDSPKSTELDKLPSEPMALETSEALFVSGTDGTHTYRIPAIITAKNGDLIAACDARRKSAADLKSQRTIDIVFRRSAATMGRHGPQSKFLIRSTMVAAVIPL